MTTALPHTLYQPGTSLLHRADPRVKVCVCLMLVAMGFAAQGWLQFLLPVLPVMLAAFVAAPSPRTIWRACWMLRWLLLFTLMTYLLFSQGRTLLGVGWLSLDGLIRGSRVCAQMLLAVVAATLLSMTTPVEDLVKACGWFAGPLQLLGCRVKEWQRILQLTLEFVPVIQGEIADAKTAAGAGREDGRSRRLVLGTVLGGFVMRLANRGDEIAHALVLSDEDDTLAGKLPRLFPLAFHDLLLTIFVILLVIGFWMVG